MRSFQTSKRCYCAFCRTKRVVYTKRHISTLDGVLVFMASLLATVILWQDFDPRAVVLFAVGLGISEMFIIFRWRMSIACPHCGFDPVLYKKTPEKAALRVKQHLEMRRLDPLSAFSPPPKLPVLRKSPVRRPQDQGATP